MRRWMELPGGPRGWFPAILFLFAVLCIPVWVGFHASVLGDLFADLTHTKGLWFGASVHVWSIVTLLAVMGLALSGGYAALERVQLAIVATMLAAMLVALFLMQPNWWLLLRGLVIPSPLAYPTWLSNTPSLNSIAETPVWMEATLYVGVIGGAGYDYLAYTSYLREKRWGMAGSAHQFITSGEQVGTLGPSELRKWLRVLLVDSVLSFITVLIFSGVFVASGHLILGPLQQIPGDGNFLQFQAQFITQVHPWLYSLYVVGVTLTMLGTLYGTLEVAPTVLREWLWGLGWNASGQQVDRWRRLTLLWCGVGAIIVVLLCMLYQIAYGRDRPPGLTKMLIPANLFTGVFSCGLIFLFNPWMDRYLPKPLRNNLVVHLACLIIGCGFLFLGFKGYWDFGGIWAFGILAFTLAIGWASAPLLNRLLRVP